jgi:hypothetical protein
MLIIDNRTLNHLADKLVPRITQPPILGRRCRQGR